LLIDLGPQIISNLIPLIFQNIISNIENQFVFIAPESVNKTLKISDHGSSDIHDVTFTVNEGQKYIVRNQEMIDAISSVYPN